MTRQMILPIRHAVLLPDVEYRLNIAGISDEERERLEADGNRAVLLGVRAEEDAEEIGIDDLNDLGVACEVLDISDGPMGLFLHAQAREKVRVSGISLAGGVFEGDTETVEEVMDVTFDGEKKLLEELKKVTIELSGKIRGGQYALEYIRKIDSVNEFAAVFCQFFDMTEEERYDLLKTGSFRERGLMVHDALMRFKGTIDLQFDLATRDDPE
ncbi:MAG: LON peptidase substrate-binding domain-containing protein, partial [Lachnospiraceae bacterium]|nr:LON peptidase substrate-binding domain-containing protein [Lachnospiraceae bacterium]